jgi:hypothetical protein
MRRKKSKIKSKPEYTGCPRTAFPEEKGSIRVNVII